MTKIRIITLVILIIASLLSAFQREYLSLSVLLTMILVIVLAQVTDNQFPKEHPKQ